MAEGNAEEISPQYFFPIVTTSEVAPGSIIVIRIPWDHDNYNIELFIRDVRSKLIKHLGHSQFLVIGIYDETQIMVYGPEGMKDILSTMAVEQLRSLASISNVPFWNWAPRSKVDENEDQKQE